MNTFRFRAECEIDVTGLQAAFFRFQHPQDRMESLVLRQLSMPEIPDTLCEIKTHMSIERVRQFMNMVEDGHVMLQTIAPADQFDGERSFRPYNEHGFAVNAAESNGKAD